MNKVKIRLKIEISYAKTSPYNNHVRQTPQWRKRIFMIERCYICLNHSISFSLLKQRRFSDWKSESTLWNVESNDVNETESSSRISSVCFQHSNIHSLLTSIWKLDRRVLLIQQNSQRFFAVKKSSSQRHVDKNDQIKQQFGVAQRFYSHLHKGWKHAGNKSHHQKKENYSQNANLSCTAISAPS